MKEEAFKAEILNVRLNEIERQLRELEDKARDLQALKGALDEWNSVPEGKDILIPVARGIFAPAKSVSDKTLKVNVGQGLVVDKTTDDVHGMLDAQLKEMQDAAQELQTEFEEGLKTLQEMEKE